MGVVFLLLIIFLLLAPTLFKGKIQQAIKDTANDNLNAVMEFSDMDLSLFKNFPDLSINLENFTLDGLDEFEGVRMAEIKDLYATVNLGSLFGDTYEIKSIQISEPTFDIRVTPEGKANYDIAKVDENAEESNSESEEGSAFAIDLQEYIITGANISYDDQSIPFSVDLKNLDHEGNGDFSADKTLLKTKTSIEEMDMVFESIRYIKQAKATIKADLDLDLANSVYTFKENEIQFNDLFLVADGFLAMPEEDMNMDLTFKTTKTDFKHLLSMVPAYFARDLNGVDIAGFMNLQGFVKGVYSENSFPEFGIDLNVDNGRFNYADLPKSVESINIDAHINNPGGSTLDNMIISVPKCYMEIAENPVDIQLTMKDAMTDPAIDCDVVASIVLDRLKDAVPLENGDALEGSLNADVSLHGRLSSIENEKYEDFKAEGQMIIQDILFKSDSLSFDMNIETGYFNFSPSFLEVSQFKTTIGKSDLQARGRFDNYLAYLMKDEVLTGTFNTQSKLFDLNEFMEVEESSVSESNDTESEEMSAIELPGNIDFTLNSNFEEMIYGDLELANVSGGIRLNEKKAMMNKVKMDVLEGQIIVDGTYDANHLNSPEMDMVLDMRNIDIKQSAEQFYTIERLAPIAKSCVGNFSTKMNLKAMLNSKMEPIEESIVGSGALTTDQVFIEKFQPLNEIANTLGIDKLAKQTIEDVNLSYEIKDGKAIVKPFNIEIDGMKTTIGGSTTLFDQNMDYTMKTDVPFEKFPSNMTSQANNILSQINNKFGSNISAGDKIPIELKITGSISKPKIGSNYGELAKGQVEDLKEEIKDQVKEEIKEKIDDGKEQARQKAQEEADKILADAQKEADKIMSEARSLADKAKAEAYKEADKVEESYQNFLEQAGKKLAADALRKTADSAHEKALNTAQAKADKILLDAKKRSDEKINSIQ